MDDVRSVNTDSSSPQGASAPTTHANLCTVLYTLSYLADQVRIFCVRSSRVRNLRGMRQLRKSLRRMRVWNGAQVSRGGDGGLHFRGTLLRRRVLQSHTHYNTAETSVESREKIKCRDCLSNGSQCV